MARQSPIVLEHVRALAHAYDAALSADGAWVLVRDFALPPGFSAPTIEVLLGLPPDYPLRGPGIWPHAIFVTPGLRYAGRALSHVVEGRGPGWGHWSWLCITRVDWRPHDTLIRTLEMVRVFLSQGARA